MIFLKAKLDKNCRLAFESKMIKNILITGGSGTIGRRLTMLLKKTGYNVSHLGRTRRNNDVKTYIWNPEKKEIETGALKDIDAIVHLAGAGIADKRWNDRQKEKILLSRTESTRLLKETLSSHAHHVTAFISSSGISYYGLEDKEKFFVESDPPENDFMATVTTAWEHEVDALSSLGLRTVKVRTGVVLNREGGALRRLETPIKYFVGAPLGSGEQYVSWIHIDDLCRIYIKAIEDTSMRGAYNAVAPHPVTNRELTRAIARALKRPLWLPAVPGFIVRIIAGEVADVVLKGGRVSSEKIEKAGFDFQFRSIDSALEDLYTR